MNQITIKRNNKNATLVIMIMIVCIFLNLFSLSVCNFVAEDGSVIGQHQSFTYFGLLASQTIGNDKCYFNVHSISSVIATVCVVVATLGICRNVTIIFPEVSIDKDINHDDIWNKLRIRTMANIVLLVLSLIVMIAGRCERECSVGFGFILVTSATTLQLITWFMLINKTISRKKWQMDAIINGQTKVKDCLNRSESDLSESTGTESATSSYAEKKTNKNDKDKTSFSQSIYNVVNMMLGTGLLVLPYTLVESGLIGGTLIILLLTFLTWRTSILTGKFMAYTAHKESTSIDEAHLPLPSSNGSSNSNDVNTSTKDQPTTLPEIARYVFGHSAAIIISASIVLDLFGALCIYFVSLGDHLNEVSGVSKTQCMMVASLLLVPLTIILRTPRMLSYLSFIGNISSFIIIIGVLVAAIGLGTEGEAEAELTTNVHSPTLIKPSGFLFSMGAVLYPLGGQPMIPTTYIYMKNKADFNSMISTSWGIILVSYLTVAWGGYYAFGDRVADQVTLSLAKTSIAGISLMTYMVVLSAISRFVLFLFIIGKSVDIFRTSFVSMNTELVGMFFRVALVFLALIISIFIQRFAVISSILGLLCVMIYAVIFPTAVSLKVFWNNITLFEKIFDGLVILFGIIGAVWGTIITMRIHS